MMGYTKFASVSLLALSVSLSGCSLFGEEEDPAEIPADLPDYREEVTIRDLWSRDVGESRADDSGMVLRVDVAGDDVYAAAHNGTVTAMLAKSGKARWRVNTRISLSAGPGVGRSLVVVASKDGQVVALDRKTGREQWRSAVSSEVLAAPVVTDRLIVVRSVDGRVFGLSSSDGTNQWSFDRTTPTLTIRGNSRPAVSRDLVIAGFDNGKMAAINARDGQTVWEASVAVPRGRSELERIIDVDGDVAISGGDIFAVSYQGRVVSMASESGRVLWKRDMSSFQGLQVADEQVLVTDDDSHVWALARSNGAAQWQQDKLHRRGLTRPTVYGEYILVGDDEGYLHVLSRRNGRVVGRTHIDSSGIRTAPVVRDGRVFVLALDGELQALQIKAIRKAPVAKPTSASN